MPTDPASPIIAPSPKAEELVTDALVDLFGVADEFFELELPFYRDGEKLIQAVKFRVLTDIVEHKKAVDHVRATVSDWFVARNQGTLPPRLDAVFVDDAEIAGKVALTCYLAENPEWKSELAWFTLARKQCNAFLGIFSKVSNASIRSDSERLLQEFQAEKKS